RNNAGVAQRAEILCRIEAETAHRAHGAGWPTSKASPNRLSCVFNDVQAMLLGNEADCVHVGALTEQMDWNNGACQRSDGILNSLRIEVEPPRTDIDNHGPSPQPPHSTRRREKGKAGHNHFIAVANVQSHESQQHGVASRSAGDGMFHTAKFCNRLLKLR